MPDVDKLAAVMTAIEEAARLLGVSTLKEWRGNKTLMALLTDSEYQALLKRLVELGKIKRAAPTPIVSLGFIDEGTDLRLLEDPHRGKLPPYDIELNYPVEEYSDTPKLEDTTLHIGQHEIKLGKGPQDFTWQYYVVAMTIKRPGKIIPETDIIERRMPGMIHLARKRVVEEATRDINKKIEKATGIKDVFKYSAGVVVYHPEYL